MALIDDVKTALRESTTDADIKGQISDIIDEAKLDLQHTANISASKIADPDALIKGAIKCYCGMIWTDDPAEADRLRSCYDDYKGRLAMSSEYGTYSSEGAET